MQYLASNRGFQSAKSRVFDSRQVKADFYPYHVSASFNPLRAASSIPGRFLAVCEGSAGSTRFNPHNAASSIPGSTSDSYIWEEGSRFQSAKKTRFDYRGE